VTYLRVVVKNLLRDPLRFSLTALGIALCIGLFVLIYSLIWGLEIGLRATMRSRLITRNAFTLNIPLPLSYEEKLRRIPGVRSVAVVNWFGGAYQERQAFPSFAVEAEPYLQMYPEYDLSPQEKAAFLQDLRGCIVGRETAERLGWKLGSIFHLESYIPTYRKKEPFEFIVRGIYDIDLGRHADGDRSRVVFHHKYLMEGVGRAVPARMYFVETPDPSMNAAVSRAIDAAFENSEYPTKTDPESVFRANLIAMGGGLVACLKLAALGGLFTVLFVVANTMSIAVRQRGKEMGVLRALGFSKPQVVGLVVAEAAFLGGLGGCLGVIFGRLALLCLPRFVVLFAIGPSIADVARSLSDSGVPWTVAAGGVMIALLVACVTAFTSASLACRKSVVDLLRRVGG